MKNLFLFGLVLIILSALTSNNENYNFKENRELASIECCRRADSLENELQLMKTMATEASHLAINARYQAIAKAMALQSSTFRGKEFRETKALIAKQAYSFNISHNGYKRDNDIVAGLYSALKELGEIKSVQSSQKVGKLFLLKDTNSSAIYSIHEWGKIDKWSSLNIPPVVLRERLNNTVILNTILSPDNQNLVLVGHSNEEAFAEIINIDDKKYSSRVMGLEGRVRQAVYDPKGSGIYFLDNNGKSLKLYNEGKLTNFIDFPSQINEIAITEDGMHLYGYDDGNQSKLYKWDLNGSLDFKIIDEHPGAITALNVVKNGEHIFYGDEKGVLTTLDFTNSESKRSIKPVHKASITSIFYSEENDILATGSYDKTIRIWDLNNFTKAPAVYSDFNNHVFSLAESGDSKSIIFSTYNQTITSILIDPESMADIICENVSRNFTKAEWKEAVGSADIPYEKTCPNLK